MEKFKEAIKWLREKWLGIALPLLGIPIIALGMWIFLNTTEDSVGVTVVVSGALFWFGLLWLT